MQRNVAGDCGIPFSLIPYPEKADGIYYQYKLWCRKERDQNGMV